MNNFYQYNSKLNKAEFLIKAKPSAKQEKIENFVQIGDDQFLKVCVSSAPEDGKANKAIITLLSKKWKIPQASICILKGTNSALKKIEIKNISEDSLKLIFAHYIL